MISCDSIQPNSQSPYTLYKLNKLDKLDTTGKQRAYSFIILRVFICIVPCPWTLLGSQMRSHQGYENVQQGKGFQSVCSKPHFVLSDYNTFRSQPS